MMQYIQASFSILLLATMSTLAQAQSNQTVDLVFMIDESGSMGDDQADVQARTKEIFARLAQETGSDGFRVGLVGFGRSSPFQPRLVQQLTNNDTVFEAAVDSLIASGSTEPGITAVFQTTTNTIGFGVSNTVEPLAKPFPGTGGYCALVITDETSNGDSNTFAQTLTALQDNGNSVFFGVGPDFTNSYESLATATNGTYYSISSFRADSDPIFQDLLVRCANRIFQNAGCSPNGPYSLEAPTGSSISVAASPSCTVGMPLSTMWSSSAAEVSFVDSTSAATDAVVSAFGMFDMEFTTVCEDPNTPGATVTATCPTTITLTAPETTCTSQEIDFAGFMAGDFVGDINSGFATVSVMDAPCAGPSGYQPMAFDTTNPPSTDEDLGTPNRRCSGGGNGRGGGGTPGSLGENCVAQGMALIISEDCMSDVPDDARSGGIIVFDFALPTKVVSVGVLDAERAGDAVVTVTKADGAVASVSAQGYGNNSYESIPVDEEGVISVSVAFASSGAIANLVVADCI